MVLGGRAQPGNGGTARRLAAGLAGVVWLALGGGAAAQRIPYPAIPRDTLLVAPQPRLYDDLAEELPSDAQADALGRKLNGQDYRPRPAIWRIGDRDTQIYLVGTIHVLPPGFAWRNALLDRLVRDSDTLIVESLDDPRGLAGLSGAAGRRALPPLGTRVSADHRAKLAAFMAGLPPDAARAMDGLPTWIAAVAVGFVRDYRAGEIPGPGADDWLEAQFRARGRRIEPIEDAARVLASVNAIPEAEQRRMLDAALDAKQPSRAQLRAPLHAWAQGDIGPKSALTIDLARSSGSSALTDPLLTRRNIAWASTLARKLKTPGTMMFAAGAGHFIGPGSLLARLQESGVRVYRVQ